MLFRNPSGLTVALVAVLIVVSFRTCLGEEISEDMEVPGFIYLGSYRPNNISERASTDEDSVRYYISKGAASWNKATTDCKARFGSGGNQARLLWFSSLDELIHVGMRLLDFLGSTQFPGIIGYWTSGIYSTSKGKWTWSTTKEDVPSWLPWRGLAPPNHTDSNSRLLIFFYNEYGFKFGAETENDVRPCICKRQAFVSPAITTPTNATVPVVPCYKTLFIVVLYFICFSLIS